MDRRWAIDGMWSAAGLQLTCYGFAPLLTAISALLPPGSTAPAATIPEMELAGLEPATS